jgi:hypothetical protein
MLVIEWSQFKGLFQNSPWHCLCLLIASRPLQAKGNEIGETRNVKKKLVLPFWWIMLLLVVSLESAVLRSPKPVALQVQVSGSPRTPWRTHLKKQLKFVELPSE